MKNILFALLLCTVARPMLGQGAPPQVAPDQPYTVEYYYKTPWGHQQEFLQLFLKNHYPLLKARRERPHTIGENRDTVQSHDRGCALGLSRHDPL